MRRRGHSTVNARAPSFSSGPPASKRACFALWAPVLSFLRHVNGAPQLPRASAGEVATGLECQALKVSSLSVLLGGLRRVYFIPTSLPFSPRSKAVDRAIACASAATTAMEKGGPFDARITGIRWVLQATEEAA
jgi:hypothetical protein